MSIFSLYLFMTQVILGDENHFSTHEQGSAPGRAARVFFCPGDFQPGPGPAIIYHLNVFLKKLPDDRDTGARHPSPIRSQEFSKSKARAWPGTDPCS